MSKKIASDGLLTKEEETAQLVSISCQRNRDADHYYFTLSIPKHGKGKIIKEVQQLVNWDYAFQ